MKIGRIIKVNAHGWGSNTGTPVAALDEFGQLFITGEWQLIFSGYYNRDDDEDFHGTNDYTTRFVKMSTQPEPFIDFCFYNRNTEGEGAMMAIGESGQLYVTGYGGWNNLGNEVDYTMDNWTVPHKL